LFFLLIKHLWRNEAAEFSLDQFGQPQRRAILQPGHTICTPTGSPPRFRAAS
jgi:hypothetical protein